MIRARAALAAAAALLAGLALAGATRIDWENQVRVTEAGSYVRGNPQAPVKLVEYASYTCDHCAHFAAEAAAPLAGRVASGQVSIEFRHALRDPLDVAAALLARCAGPERFFAASDAIFAAQPELLAKARAMTPPASREPAQIVAAYAKGTGLVPIVARFGVTPARADRCLADTAELKRLTDMADEAWQVRKIPGTPHFLINGAPVPSTSWTGLAPRLIP